MSSFPFFKNGVCSGTVTVLNSKERVIDCELLCKLKHDIIAFKAAAPPDFRASYTGSGLPFASPAMAFENTKSHGKVQLENRKCSITIALPNSYYVALGTVLVPPTIYIQYVSHLDTVETIEIQVDESIPYRTLTYQNKRTSPMFYTNTSPVLPVRSQEQILRDSAYPTCTMTMPVNHWGLKPSF
jgi:hypothetical protein